jgi:ELWxxDGT repeat protein
MILYYFRTPNFLNQKLKNMKTILRFTSLIVALCFTSLTYGQTTKLSNNTNLNAFLITNNRAVLLSHMDKDNTLWTTDGTPAGTMQYTTKVTLDSNVIPGVLGDKIYFAGTDAANGSELWVTDGTDAGTTLVKDIEAGANSSTPYNFFPYNSQLLFFAGTAATGIELWKTDGTATGTVMVKDINPGKGSSGENTFNYFANNGIVYFVADDGTNGSELWKTNGTPEGTVMVKDINPGAGNGIGGDGPLGSFTQFTTLGTMTLFTADNGTSGIELWQTDGTTEGTKLLKDINPGPLPSSPGIFVAVNNKIFFAANTIMEGTELWATDGTEEGTSLVKDINAGPLPSVQLLLFSIIFGDRLVFTATDAANGAELWSTDGTTAGTTLLKDINPGTDGSNGILLPDFRSGDFHTPPFNGKAFLVAGTEAEGRELWITDGTAPGTVLVKDIYPGAEDGVEGASFFYTQNALYFAGQGSDATGAELWKTDGTEAGTVQIKDINPGANSSNLAFNFAFKNQLYITADDGDNATRLRDLFVLDETVTLPINLFNFAATVQQSKAVKLDWSTTNEINSSHFAIERSANGIHFNNIDKVNAAGNSGLQRRYGYIDPQPSHLNNPILYYRLKMVDKDGSYKYSSVLAVHFKESSFRFTFSPNPVQNQLSVIVAAGGSKSIALRITDASGKQVYQQTLSSSRSIAQQNINVAGWQKGIYVIQLITNNSIKTAKFVKQ